MIIAFLKFLIDSLAFGATFIYGSTGEIITEKSGHLNLGIPGIMCIGGASGCMILNVIGKSSLPQFLIVLLGIICSFVGASLMGVLYCFLTVTLRANQNVTGLAMTTFGVGLMKVLMSKLDSNVYLNKPKTYYRAPFYEIVKANKTMQLKEIQLLGIMFFLAIVVAIVASYVLNKTRVGLNLRAVGENPATADAVGIDVTKYKYVATCIGSGIAGLGGLYYIVDYMGSLEAYKSIEAFGWLSIALVIFALWKPNMTILGSFVFGTLFSCGSFLAPWLNLSLAWGPIMKMLPYVATIVVLIISSIKNKRENQPPASLGLNYFREDR